MTDVEDMERIPTFRRTSLITRHRSFGAKTLLVFGIILSAIIALACIWRAFFWMAVGGEHGPKSVSVTGEAGAIGIVYFLVCVAFVWFCRALMLVF